MGRKEETRREKDADATGQMQKKEKGVTSRAYEDSGKEQSDVYGDNQAFG